MKTSHSTTLADKITDEFKLGVSDLFIQHLSELKIFSETMAYINFPNANVFDKVIKEKLKQVKSYNPNTPQIQQLEKRLAETQNEQEKIALTKEIRREIYSGYINHCASICADLPLLFQTNFISPIKSGEMKRLDVNCFTYITAVQTQMGYLQLYNLAMSQLPLAERIAYPMLPPEHEAIHKPKKAAKSTLGKSLQTAGTIASSVSSQAASIAYQMTPTTVSKTLETVAQSYLPEMVESLGTSQLDELFLATEEFKRKNEIFADRIKAVHNTIGYEFVLPHSAEKESMPQEGGEYALAKTGASLLQSFLSATEKGLTEELKREILHSGSEMAGVLTNMYRTDAGNFNVEKFTYALAETASVFGQTHFPKLTQAVRTGSEILRNPDLMHFLESPRLIPIHYTSEILHVTNELKSIIVNNPALFNEEERGAILEPLDEATALWEDVKSKHETQENKHKEARKSISGLIENVKEFEKRILGAKENEPRIKIWKEIISSNKEEIHFLQSMIENEENSLLKQAEKVMPLVHEKCRESLWKAAFNTKPHPQGHIETEMAQVIAEMLNSSLNYTLYPKYVIEGLTKTYGQHFVGTLGSYGNYLYGLHLSLEAFHKISQYQKLKNEYDALKVEEVVQREIRKEEKQKMPHASKEKVKVKEKPTIETKFYLHSSGGGGHTAAMKAKVQEDLDSAKDQGRDLKNFKPLTIDLLVDWLGLVGELSVKAWNDAQKRGDVQKQEELVAQQPLGNLVFGTFVYNKLYKLLIDNPQLKEVVSTQAMCTPSLCQAILDINKATGRNIKLKLVMTDLPTEKAVHFWNGLKDLTSEQRSILTLETISPDVSNVQYSKQTHGMASQRLQTVDFEKVAIKSFFDKHCGPGLKVEIVEPPLRKEFKAGNHRTRDEINASGLNFSFKNDLEREVFEAANGHIEKGKGVATVSINENDTVASLMLGSQGGIAILDYIQEYAKHYSPNAKGGNTLFFVYCGAGQSGMPSELFIKAKQLIDEMKREGRLPEGLIVVPLGMQDATAIAENYARNDLTIMRSGGLASFEALECAKENKQNQFLIHSEGHSEDVNALRKAIPVWEGGNAEYLESKIGAQIVNADRFGKFLEGKLSAPAAKGNHQRSRMIFTDLGSPSLKKDIEKTFVRIQFYLEKNMYPELLNDINKLLIHPGIKGEHRSQVNKEIKRCMDNADRAKQDKKGDDYKKFSEIKTVVEDLLKPAGSFKSSGRKPT
jgi:hypothetical protein